MRKICLCFTFAMVAMLLRVDPSNAQSIGDYPDPSGTHLCSDYVTYWVKAAKEAAALGCYRQGAMWSTDPKTQGDFCLSASDSDIDERTKIMQRQIDTCELCAGEADAVVAAIITNVTHRCGFTDPDGRWNLTRESAYKKCALLYEESNGRWSLIIDLMDMQYKVGMCYQTNPDQQCVSCHNSHSASAAQATSNSGSALRKAIERLPRRPKAVTGDDPCKPGLRSTDGRCKQIPASVINPGILEGDRGDARQAPGAIGTPVAPTAIPPYRTR